MPLQHLSEVLSSWCHHHDEMKILSNTSGELPQQFGDSVWLFHQRRFVLLDDIGHGNLTFILLPFLLLICLLSFSICDFHSVDFLISMLERVKLRFSLLSFFVEHDAS